MILHTLLSCSFTGNDPTPKATVVVITLDTTRQDRIGAYGYPYGKTETIDSFAERGYLFTKAYSTVPLTTLNLIDVHWIVPIASSHS